MPYINKSKFVETKKQRWERDNLIRSIEEITGIQREQWEQVSTKQRDLVRIRRIYIYLLNRQLGYTGNIICQMISDSTVMTQYSRAVQFIKKELESPEENLTKQEITAILKDYEERPAYNFDTIA